MRPRSGGMYTVRCFAASTFAWYSSALHALQEPQAGAEQPDEEQGHQGQHAEAAAAPVNGHGNILVDSMTKRRATM